METLEIAANSTVVITDATGREFRTRALSGVETVGHSFPIVWVERPLTTGETDRVPWPAEAVRNVRPNDEPSTGDGKDQTPTESEREHSKNPAHEGPGE